MLQIADPAYLAQQFRRKPAAAALPELCTHAVGNFDDFNEWTLALQFALEDANTVKEGLQVAVAGVPDREASDRAVDSCQQLELVGNFLRGWGEHPRAALGSTFKKPFLLQNAQGLAHRGATNAQRLR